MGSELLKPNFVIVQQSALIIVDKHRCRDVHCIHEAQSLLNSALAHEVFNRLRDVHKPRRFGTSNQDAPLAIFIFFSWNVARESMTLYLPFRRIGSWHDSRSQSRVSSIPECMPAISLYLMK